uniref:FBD domain-containing protein n=1 Tax=Oryza punctata TaxID=4537 RepID=A0A0E0LM04_ORYPU
MSYRENSAMGNLKLKLKVGETYSGETGTRRTIGENKQNDCPCSQPENQITNGIVLDSLQEIEIRNFRGTEDDVDLVKMLLRCKPIPKRVTFHLSSEIKNDDYSLNGYVMSLQR